MKNFKIKLEGDYLQSSYAVYVIELIHQGEQYYYIGQTGDNHYISARPAFRRLTGHLENKNRSTQNQIYKYIAYEILKFRKRDKKEDFEIDEKAQIEKWLAASTLEMSVYPLEVFDFHASKEEHTTKRRATQEFEKQVIQLFIQEGKPLINKSRPKAKEAGVHYEEQLDNIIQDFDIKK
jgi:hypothetical protein